MAQAEAHAGGKAAAGVAPFDVLCPDAQAGTPTLFVRLYRALVLPIVRAILRVVMRSSVPTSHSMLLMRTYFADYGMPHANDDTIAPRFRAVLLPEEARYIAARTLYGDLRGRLIILPVLGVPGIGRFVDVRTAWLDRVVADGLEGGATQVVVIAAGFDTRAYRFARPGVRFFEVDLPPSSKAKRALVAQTLPDEAAYPRPAFVGADLSKVPLAEALQGTGFDASTKTVFLAEGLIYYLPPGAVRALFESVRDLAAPGSRFAFDWLRSSVAAGRRFEPSYETLAATVSNRGEPFLSAVNDERPGALEALASAFGFGCVFTAGARAMAELFYKPGEVPWKTFPATVTPCFSYALWERRDDAAGAPAGAATGAGAGGAQ